MEEYKRVSDNAINVTIAWARANAAGRRHRMKSFQSQNKSSFSNDGTEQMIPDDHPANKFGKTFEKEIIQKQTSSSKNPSGLHVQTVPSIVEFRAGYWSDCEDQSDPFSQRQGDISISNNSDHQVKAEVEVLTTSQVSTKLPVIYNRGYLPVEDEVFEGKCIKISEAKEALDMIIRDCGDHKANVAYEQFEPSRMHVSRRAEKRKRKQEAAKAESGPTIFIFKALPLPDGTLVKNNVFALTAAAAARSINKSLLTSCGEEKRDDVEEAEKRSKDKHIAHRSIVEETEVKIMARIGAMEQCMASAKRILDWHEPARSQVIVSRKVALVRLRQEIAKLQAKFCRRRRCCVDIESLLYETGAKRTEMGKTESKNEAKSEEMDEEHNKELPLSERHQVWLEERDRRLSALRTIHKKEQNEATREFEKFATCVSWAKAKESSKAIREVEIQNELSRKKRIDEIAVQGQMNREKELTKLREATANISRNVVSTKNSKSNQEKALAKLSQPREVVSKMAKPTPDEVKIGLKENAHRSRRLETLRRNQTANVTPFAVKAFKTATELNGQVKPKGLASAILMQAGRNENVECNLSQKTDLEFEKWLRKYETHV